MIAQEPAVVLHMAFVEARQKQHEFITVEHLLLAMLDNPSGAEVLKACGVDLDELRGVLTDFINEHTPRLSPHSDADTSRPRVSSASSSAPFCTSSHPARRKSPAPTCWSRFSARRNRTRSIFSTSAASPAW